MGSSTEPISFNKLHKELAAVQGSTRNKASLKENVGRLAKSELLTFAVLPNGQFQIGSTDLVAG